MGIFFRTAFVQGFFPCRDHTFLVVEDEMAGSDHDPFPIHPGGDPVGHDVFHFAVHLFMGEPFVRCLAHYGVGHGMGEMFLQAGCIPEHRGPVIPVEAEYVSHFGLGQGQGTGFVEDNGIRLGHRFQEFSPLDGDLVGAAFPHGGQYRQRHGKLQGTGEIHHQDGHGPGQVPGQQIGEQGPAQAPRHQTVCQMAGPAFQVGLEGFGILDHLHDPIVPVAAGPAFHPDGDFPVFHHGAGVYRQARCLVDGHGFPGHGGLVHHGVALGHFPIQRDGAAHLHADQIPGLHIGQGYFHFRAIHHFPHCVDVEGHVVRQIMDGFLIGPFFQQFPDPQQQHDGTGGADVLLEHGRRNGRGIQYRYIQPAVAQGFQSQADEAQGMVPASCHPDRQGQEPLAGKMPGQEGQQPVPVLPIQHQGSGFFLGGFPQFRIVHVQPGQGLEDPFPDFPQVIGPVQDSDPGSAGIQLYRPDPGDPFQTAQDGRTLFQAEGTDHPSLLGQAADPETAGCFMLNLEFHKASAPFPEEKSLFGLVFNNGSSRFFLGFLCSFRVFQLLVFFLGSSYDIVSLCLEGSRAFSSAFLHPQGRSGSLDQGFLHQLGFDHPFSQKAQYSASSNQTRFDPIFSFHCKMAPFSGSINPMGLRKFSPEHFAY